jgi:bacterioferritin (cytochrome b1)
MVWNRFRKAWNQLLQSAHDGRRKVLEVLCQRYVDETRSSLQFQSHARQMCYPQFRDKLLDIAKEEEKHAEWLKHRIISLAGEVPRVTFAPEQGVNSWEKLRLDIAAEKHCIGELEDQLLKLEGIDAQTVKILRQILEDEKKHREDMIAMMMRSDPQAGWA